MQSLRCLHIGGLGLVHQRELLELLDVEQRLEQPRLEDPDNPHDGGAQLPLVLLGVEACVVVLLTSSNFLSFYYVNPTGRDIIVPWTLSPIISWSCSPNMDPEDGAGDTITDVLVINFILFHANHIDNW